MEDSLYRLMAQVEDNHWWFAGRRNVIDAAIRDIIKPAPRATILDVGCGTGGNLSLLSRFGQVSGLEMDAGAVEAAQRRGLGYIHTGKIPGRLSFEENSFDLITMLDVLEHIENDSEAIGYLRRFLKPGGSFLITVPAFSFLWSSHDTLHHHCRRYHKLQLEKKLAAAGLDVTYSSYFNTWLFPLILMVRMIKSGLKINTDHGDLGMLPAPFNRLLTLIFSSEKYFVKRKWKLPVGVSIIACGKKPVPAGQSM